MYGWISNLFGKTFVALKGNVPSYKSQGHSAHKTCLSNKNRFVSNLSQKFDCQTSVSPLTYISWSLAFSF